MITVNSIQTAMAVIITLAMAIFAYTDFRERRIPNRILLPVALIWPLLMVMAFLTGQEGAFGLMVKCIAGAAIAGGAFLLCYIIVRGKLGAGDVKMAALMGLYLGSDKIATALIAGIVISAIYSVIMILAKKLTVKDGLPMAPFLFLGTIIALLYTKFPANYITAYFTIQEKNDFSSEKMNSCRFSLGYSLFRPEGALYLSDMGFS